MVMVVEIIELPSACPSFAFTVQETWEPPVGAVSVLLFPVITPSIDQEISLVGGSYDAEIGTDWWGTHGYGPLAGKELKEFTRDEYGFFLVTRLTGYTVESAMGLIEKANHSYGARGTHVLDLATNINDTGYKFWNDDLYVTNTTLNGTKNLPVIFDEETEFLTNMSNVIGYAS